MLAFFAPGPTEIILIILGLLLLFGGKKIPELMRGLGTGLKEFKKSSNLDEPDERPREPSRIDRNPPTTSDPVSTGDPL